MDVPRATRTLRIDGMHDEGCEQKVRAALEGVAGVTTESVRVGAATIRGDDRAAIARACAAINGAGFRAWETRTPAEKARARLGDAGPDAAHTDPDSGAGRAGGAAEPTPPGDGGRTDG